MGNLQGSEGRKGGGGKSPAKGKKDKSGANKKAAAKEAKQSKGPAPMPPSAAPTASAYSSQAASKLPVAREQRPAAAAAAGAYDAGPSSGKQPGVTVPANGTARARENLTEASVVSEAACAERTATADTRKLQPLPTTASAVNDSDTTTYVVTDSWRHVKKLSIKTPSALSGPSASGSAVHSAVLLTPPSRDSSYESVFMDPLTPQSFAEARAGSVASSYYSDAGTMVLNDRAEAAGHAERESNRAAASAVVATATATATACTSSAVERSGTYGVLASAESTAGGMVVRPQALSPDHVFVALVGEEEPNDASAACSAEANVNSAANDAPPAKFPQQPSFNVVRHRKVELGPTCLSDNSLLSGEVEAPPTKPRVENKPEPRDTRRHSSVSDSPLDSNVLRKVASLTLDRSTIDQRVTKPRFVPEKLDFQLYEKFEGQMLINWFASSFQDDHYIRTMLSINDIRLLAIQFCTHLLEAGVVRHVPDKDVVMDTLFRPDLMYFWSHHETSVATPPTPGRLPSAAWPPASPGFLDFNSHTQVAHSPDSSHNETLMDIKREHRGSMSKMRQEGGIFSMRCGNNQKVSEYEEKIADLENTIVKLQQEMERDKTIANIQSLTEKTNTDFGSPTTEKKLMNLPLKKDEETNTVSNVVEKSDMATDTCNLREDFTEHKENKLDSLHNIEERENLESASETTEMDKPSNATINFTELNEQNLTTIQPINSASVLEQIPVDTSKENGQGKLVPELEDKADSLLSTIPVISAQKNSSEENLHSNVDICENKSEVDPSSNTMVELAKASLPVLMSDTSKEAEDTCQSSSITKELSLPIMDLTSASPEKDKSTKSDSNYVYPSSVSLSQSSEENSSLQPNSQTSQTEPCPSSLSVTKPPLIPETPELPAQEASSIHPPSSDIQLPLSDITEPAPPNLPSESPSFPPMAKTGHTPSHAPSIEPPPPPPMPEMGPPPPVTGVDTPPPLMPEVGPPPPPMPGMGPPPPPLPGMCPPPPPMPGMGPPPPPPMPAMGPPPPPPMPAMGPPPPPPMPGMGPPPPPPPMPGMVPPPSLMPGMGPPPPPMPGMGPPPPPMPGMGPPPPPPMSPMPFPAPPVGGWMANRTMAPGAAPAFRKQPLNPEVPMKPLYWTRIIVPVSVSSETNTVTEGSTSVTPSELLWNKLEEEKIEDMTEFHNLFSRQVIERTPARRREEKPSKQQAVKILDSKRSQNVGILSSSLHLDFSEIENAIYNFDTSIVNIEALQQIYEVRATDDELTKIRKHLNTQPDIPLDKPEQFLFELAQIPNFAERIACFMFQSEFDDGISNIESKLNNLKSTCECLTTSDNLKTVMAIILTVGNYMNGGNRTRGQADGFGLEILSKLRDVKSNDSSITLLHFIVRTYMKKCDDPLNPELPLPVPEPGDINRAASVQFDDINTDLQRLQKELDTCKRKSEKVIEDSTEETLHPFKNKMETFLENAQKQLSGEMDNLGECKLKFKGTMNFYHYQPKGDSEGNDVAPKDFFAFWYPFCSDFKDIWKKEQQRLLKDKVQEAKRKQLERLNVKTTKKKEGGLKARLQMKGLQAKSS